MAEATDRQSLEPERWVERHGDVLYRYALVRLGDADQAENVVQEALLAALQSRDSFSGRSTERTWLVGILKYKIIDAYRQRSRESARASVDELAPFPDEDFNRRGHWQNPPASWDNPAATIESAQLLEVFERCVQLLKPRLATAFTLRAMDDLPTEEICKILDITQTNLGVMLHRARHALRSCLERGWFAAAK